MPPKLTRYTENNIDLLFFTCDNAKSFHLDFVVVKTQQMFGSHGGLLTNAMFYHMGIKIKLRYYTKKGNRSQLADRHS